MTIGAWIVLLIFATSIIGFGVYRIKDSCGDKSEIKQGVLIIGAAIVFSSCFVWYMSTSAVGKRALKDQEINLQNGTQRTVRVFDINGNQIEEYMGFFDIETDKESYILFDDENGKRHIIYYTTGTIIVDET